MTFTYSCGWPPSLLGERVKCNSWIREAPDPRSQIWSGSGFDELCVCGVFKTVMDLRMVRRSELWTHSVVQGDEASFHGDRSV